MNRVAVAVLLLGLFGVAACGGDEPEPAVELPSWAKVAPEQIAEAKKHGVAVAFENDLGMRFVLIPAGAFLMGSPSTEALRQTRETQHPVHLKRPFYLQVTEVTNGQFKACRPDHSARQERQGNPLDGESQPVVRVSHGDAVAFASWLTQRKWNRMYRLPTEAEWERAARAGSTVSLRQACKI